MVFNQTLTIPSGLLLVFLITLNKFWETTTDCKQNKISDCF